MKNKKYVKNVKPTTKQEAVVYSKIDKKMDSLLREYVNGSISDEQINQQTKYFNSLLEKENTNRLVLIELIIEHKLTKVCLEAFNKRKMEDVSYRQLIKFTKEHQLVLDKINTSKSRKENENIKKFNKLIKIIKENDMFKEFMDKYELSHASNASISQLEEFVLLNELISDVDFIRIVKINEEDLDEYKKRLETINLLRDNKEVRNCVKSYGVSSISDLSTEQIEDYINNKMKIDR